MQDKNQAERDAALEEAVLIVEAFNFESEAQARIVAERIRALKGNQNSSNASPDLSALPLESEATQGAPNSPQMDWQQVSLNGGPPCFSTMLATGRSGWYCGRAERWAGHGMLHKFVSLDNLLAAIITEYGAPALKWQNVGTAPKDGTPFRAYSADLVHPDFNPWGSVEAVFDGEQFIGAVWDGQFDCWNTVPINPTLWMPIEDSPSYQRK